MTLTPWVWHDARSVFFDYRSLGSRIVSVTGATVKNSTG